MGYKFLMALCMWEGNDLSQSCGCLEFGTDSAVCYDYHSIEPLLFRLRTTSVFAVHKILLAEQC